MHLTTKNPQPHPTVGGYFPPPLGEAGQRSDLGNTGHLAGFLLKPPYMCAFAFEATFRFCIIGLVSFGFSLGCHGNKLLINSNYPPVE